ncbi:MAG: insulinase family protein [Myxococcales bacterium]|nr:insulinase family protein [Myxococcales bacterium]
MSRSLVGTRVTLDTAVTDSGLRVIVLPCTLPVACVGIVSSVGTCVERSPGTLHFLEHMLFLGSTRRSGYLSDEIEALGGTVQAFTAFDLMATSVKVPAAHTHEAARVLADHTLWPTIDAGDVRDERRVIIAELMESEGELWRPVVLAVRRALYPHGHPYRFDPLGARETVEGVSASVLRDLHGYVVSPSRTVVVAAGPVDAKSLARCFSGSRARPEVDDSPHIRHHRLAVDPPGASIDGRTPRAFPQLAAAWVLPDVRSPASLPLSVAARGIGQLLANSSPQTLGVHIPRKGSSLFVLIGPGTSDPRSEMRRLRSLPERFIETFDIDDLRRTCEIEQMTSLDAVNVPAWLGDAIVTHHEPLRPWHDLARLRSLGAEELRLTTSAYLAQERALQVQLTPEPHTPPLAAAKRRPPPKVRSALPEVERLENGIIYAPLESFASMTSSIEAVIPTGVFGSWDASVRARELFEEGLCDPLTSVTLEHHGLVVTTRCHGDTPERVRHLVTRVAELLDSDLPAEVTPQVAREEQRASVIRGALGDCTVQWSGRSPIIAISGMAVTTEERSELAELTLDPVSPTRRARTVLGTPSWRPRVVQSPFLPLGFVAVGFAMPTLGDAEASACELFCRLLGGESGWLFERVRNMLGLVYDIRAEYICAAEGGCLLVTAITPAQPHEVYEETRSVLEAAVEAAEHTKEIELARARAVGNVVATMSSPDTASSWLALGETCSAQLSPGRWIERLRSTKAADVAAAAERWIAPGPTSVSLIVPRRNG